MPCVGPRDLGVGEAVAVDVGAGPSVPVCTWFFTPLLESSPQTGASLTDVTVIDMVAEFESAVPSLARNVKLSGPW